jgi:toxin HigB-1
MDVQFDDDDLARVARDKKVTGGWSPGIVKAFRKVVGFIIAADDERDFYGMRSMHFERLSGARKHQHSLRINNQYRLIIELGGKGRTKIVHIIGIEDYH